MITDLRQSIGSNRPERTWPTLYKKSNTGAILTWNICVEGNVITAVFGHLHGEQQFTRDLITSGKNLGKKNATTPEEQAVLEAEAKWKKKVEREGYVIDLGRAQAGETDAAGGIAPMLAQQYEVARKHILFPCDAQPKLNGIRCIVVVDHGRVTLWSRKRQQIFGVPHIQAAYEEFFEEEPGVHTFDGELYRHGWPLQKIGGFVRKTKGVKEGYEELCHHVYDLPTFPGEWRRRKEALVNIFANGLGLAGVGPIRYVPSITVNDSFKTVKRLHDEWVEGGFEGVILRNHEAIYEAGKRSHHLAKVKEFEEKEFEIVGVTHGRGRMAEGAIFVCKAENGELFECTAPGTMEEKTQFLFRRNEVIGKQLTVKFLERTESGKPSHGVGVAVRDYE